MISLSLWILILSSKKQTLLKTFGKQEDINIEDFFLIVILFLTKTIKQLKNKIFLHLYLLLKDLHSK